jgi:HicB family
MSKASYPLKLPASVKAAAVRLAKEDGVSLNQWISVAIAQKIGVVETAADFLARRVGKAKAADMLPFLNKAKREAPPVGDEV